MKLFLLFSLLMCPLLYSQEYNSADSTDIVPNDPEIINSSDNDQPQFLSDSDESTGYSDPYIPTIHGFAFSVGKTTYFERDLFNNPDKVSFKPAYSISGMLSGGNELFRVDLDARFVGKNFTLPSVTGIDDYYFLLGSFGLRLRYHIPSNIVEPYILGSVYYNYGEVDFQSMDYKEIFRGISLGFGPGVSLPISKVVSIGFEGILELGWGSWNEKPVFNSGGISVNLNNIRLQAVINFLL